MEDYDITEPEYRHDVETLVKLFQAEQRIPCIEPFAHPLVEKEASSSLGRHYPLHDDCGAPPFVENPKGVIREKGADKYCLVAHNRSGVPVAYVAFSISLSYCEDVDPDMAIAAGDLDSLACICLVVRVDEFYVRKQFRRRGAAAAMAEVVCHAFQAELEHLCKTVPIVAERNRVELTVRPYFDMDFDSQSCVMIDALVRSALVDVIDTFRANIASPLLKVEDLTTDTGY
ncbi:hypothetical protein F6X40_34595 [Paraburkholderia sp. UCT31]|uniref:hypothetical protein n=1 Tax=Paraburkholderia sp. UCT31 TaxID=2615209 RepID=UPI0016561A4B|nr:hypothetical protein [Paraburkholderia sp. UCT31]MBC8741693.1 hypothetical protein [Paraburkholderia sp. UCT31]